MNPRPFLIGLGALAFSVCAGGLPAVVLLSRGSASSALAPSQLASEDLRNLGYLDKEASAWAGEPAPMEEAKVDGFVGRKKSEAAPGATRLRSQAIPDGVIGGEGGLDENEVDSLGGEEREPASTRQWFPEAFLWAPIVETDASGVATLDVRVPDQLTTWRVLGLAHDRSGMQAGSVHTFDSRLPVYVDPVVPAWLYAGDRVDLPVQVVNTTPGRVAGRVTVEASGALRGGGDADVALGPHASAVRVVRLLTAGAGASTVSARLLADASDAAERTIPVLPSGRPVAETTGGSVATSRALRLKAPIAADPTTQALTVRVFPGPLAMLQAELERVAGGAAPADPAYGFALARALTDLAARSGIAMDPKTVRKLQLTAWQRVAREARSPDAGVAADLLIALSGVHDHALVDGLRPRLVHALVQGQRGDGTWARQPSASLQQVIVQTALAARALPEDQVGARLRAAGAIERYQREITEPYTAAVVLASGLADDALAARLVALVVEGSPTREDGARGVSVPVSARNAWGYRPSEEEALAWTALALADADVPWTGDLVAELMRHYDARAGFGAGRADAVALEAIARWMPGVSAPVDVGLVHQGAEVARARLDPAQPLVPAVLVAMPGGALEGWEVRLGSEVPGVAFVAELASWVPWTGDERLPGVEIEVSAGPMVAGRDGRVALRVAAPSGTAVAIEQGIPAGAAVDELALASLSGMVTSVEVETDRVRLVTRAFGAGEVMDLGLVVRPAFAGSFQTVPLVVEAGGSRVERAPLLWTVADASTGT